MLHVNMSYIICRIDRCIITIQEVALFMFYVLSTSADKQVNLKCAEFEMEFGLTVINMCQDAQVPGVGRIPLQWNDLLQADVSEPHDEQLKQMKTLNTHLTHTHLHWLTADLC